MPFEPGHPVIAQGLAKFIEQPRFAETRLAGNRDRLSVARFDARQTIAQLRQFGAAADELGQSLLGLQVERIAPLTPARYLEQHSRLALASDLDRPQRFGDDFAGDRMVGV